LVRGLRRALNERPREAPTVILNLRNPRQLAFIVGIGLCFFGALLFKIDVSLEYREAGRLEVAWGDGEGQIPLTTSRDGTQFGIRCFCEGPGGVTFVADWRNGRVLKYDGSGDLVETLDVGRRRGNLDDMVLRSDGTLLVADNSTAEIVAVPSEGRPQVLWCGRSPGLLDSHIESIQAGGDGLVYVTATLLSDGEYRRSMIAVEGDAGANGPRTIAEVVMTPSGSRRYSGFQGEPPAGAVTFRASRQGGFYAAPVGGDSSSRSARPSYVRRYRRDGSLSREYKVEVRGPAEALTVAGDDRAGRLYVGISLGTPSGRVRVYDRDGTLSAELAAPYLGKERSHSYLRVDPEGVLSILEAGEHGATIRRLAPVRRRLLARR